VFLGNDLTTPNFYMYSFRAKKVMILSDPKHWDHISPFMQPGDVPHRIALTDVDIPSIHDVGDREDGDVYIDVVTTRSQTVSKLRASGCLVSILRPRTLLTTTRIFLTPIRDFLGSRLGLRRYTLRDVIALLRTRLDSILYIGPLLHINLFESYIIGTPIRIYVFCLSDSVKKRL
jgi:hypothetical protein